MRSRRLVLADSELSGAEADDGDVLVYWNSKSVEGGVHSIPRLCEKDYERYRAAFLAWTYELGEREVNGLSLKEHFLVPERGLSLWYMTLMAEMSSLKSSASYDATKLMAFEELFNRLRCRQLVYRGSRRELNQTLHGWCRSQGIGYRWERVREARPAESWKRRLRNRLPTSLRALLFFRERWQSRARRARAQLAEAPVEALPGASIVTYFPNFDARSMEQGEFRSNYWGALHGLLDVLKLSINWIWIQVDSEQAGFEETLALRARCNEQGKAKYRFHLVEDFCSPAVLRAALSRWRWARRVARGLGDMSDAFRFRGSTINFYPLFARDWSESFFGDVGLDNAVWIELFPELAARVPARPWGLFIWENHPWELPLQAAWRARGVKPVYAFQHSTLRALDPRFYADPRVYRPEEREFRPLPDSIVVNGVSGEKFLRETGCPSQYIRRAEAVRFKSLEGRHGELAKPLPERDRALLVIGGFMPEEGRLQLRLLAQAARNGALARYSKVLIKPHPYFELDGLLKEVAPTFEYSIVHEPLDALWPKVDVVYCANSTSAYLEAAWLGLPVICTDSPEEPNLNPMFGVKDVPFITEAPVLARALEAPEPSPVPQDFLVFDSGLRAWRELLEPAGDLREKGVQ